MKNSPLVILASALIGAEAFAVPVLIQNHSFELPALAEGASTNGVITNWNSFGCPDRCAGVFNPQVGASDFPSGTVPDGNNALYISQRVAQTLTATVQANTIYTVTLLIGNPANRPDNQGFGFALTALGGSDILSFNALLTTLPNSNGTFVELSLSSPVLAGDPNIGRTLQINLYGLQFSGPGRQYVAFDNVRLDATPVPEPTSFLLLVSGLAALSLLQRQVRS